MRTRLLTLLFALLVLPQPEAVAATQPAHSFGWKGENFLLDGKPFAPLFEKEGLGEICF